MDGFSRLFAQGIFLKKTNFISVGLLLCGIGGWLPATTTTYTGVNTIDTPTENLSGDSIVNQGSLEYQSSLLNDAGASIENEAPDSGDADDDGAVLETASFTNEGLFDNANTYTNAGTLLNESGGILSNEGVSSVRLKTEQWQLVFGSGLFESEPIA